MATLPELLDAIFVEFTTWTFLGIMGIIGSSILVYFKSLKKYQRETAQEVVALKTDI